MMCGFVFRGHCCGAVPCVLGGFGLWFGWAGCGGFVLMVVRLSGFGLVHFGCSFGWVWFDLLCGLDGIVVSCLLLVALIALVSCSGLWFGFACRVWVGWCNSRIWL